MRQDVAKLAEGRSSCLVAFTIRDFDVARESWPSAMIAAQSHPRPTPSAASTRTTSSFAPPRSRR